MVTHPKVFEKIYIKRLISIILKNDLIPERQFGMREKHETIEQVHRSVNIINSDLAFDKVWHEKLQYKIKIYLPHLHYQLLKSDLSDSHFPVKVGNEYTNDLYSILSGVPQSSVLGPALYLFYTNVRG